MSVASLPALTANADGLSEIAIAKWNTSQPGVIIASFVPISSTGDSYGLNYVMQLYKDGNLIDTKENKQSSVDMSEIICSHGYGKYIFKVKAVEFDYSTNEPTGNETQFKESDELDYKPFDGEKTSTVALIVSRDSSVFKNGSTDNGFTLTLNNVNLTVGTKEFPTSDIDENKKRIFIERTFGITTNRDLEIVL